MDQDGRTAIALYKRKIKTRQLSNLESAIESLEANVTPVKGAKHSFHLGPWRRSKKKIHKSEDLKRVEEHYAKTRRTPLWENKAMKHVVKKVHTWLWHADNQVYNDYASVEAERYFGEAYLMAVLNKGGSGPHYDKMDEPEGLCCVVPYGKYSGGDLVFPELELRFVVRPGDILFFRSRELMHENFAVKGHRRSIVFTICHNCFTSLGQANDRALHYLYYEQKNINSDSEDKLSETDSSEDKLSETDSSSEGDRK
jgi:hypothetical protein